MGQKPLYNPLPTGQRQAVPGVQGAPAPPPQVPQQPGLGGLAKQVAVERAGGILPAKQFPQSMMKPVDPLTQLLLLRELGQ